MDSGEPSGALKGAVVHILPSRLKAGYKREGIAPAAVELGRVLINPVLDRGSTNVRFTPKATKLLRRSENDANGMDRPCSRPEPLRG